MFTNLELCQKLCQNHFLIFLQAPFWFGCAWTPLSRLSCSCRLTDPIASVVHQRYKFKPCVTQREPRKTHLDKSHLDILWHTSSTCDRPRYWRISSPRRSQCQSWPRESKKVDLSSDRTVGDNRAVNKLWLVWTKYEIYIIHEMIIVSHLILWIIRAQYGHPY